MPGSWGWVGTIYVAKCVGDLAEIAYYLQDVGGPDPGQHNVNNTTQNMPFMEPTRPTDDAVRLLYRCSQVILTLCAVLVATGLGMYVLGDNKENIMPEMFRRKTNTARTGNPMTQMDVG